MRIARVGPSPAWWVAAFIVGAGWVAGFLLWRQPATREEYGTYFDIGVPAAMLVLGAPAAAIAAVLRSSSSRARHAVGSLLMWLTAVGLASLASFAFFGGICMDENDVCLTTWPSRVLALASALGVLAVAGVLEHLARGALTRR